MFTKKLFPGSSLELPILGFGAAPLGGLYGDVEDGKLLVKLAIDKGINYFDTSPYYGNSEIVLGECLKEITREKYIISTKGGRLSENTFNYSPEHINHSINTSLSRLY